MIIENKLEQFYKATLESATNQKIAILDEFEESLQKKIELDKEATIRKAELFCQGEEKRILRRKNRGISNANLQTKRILNETSKKITNNVFEEVRNRLKEYMKTPDYVLLLEHQINKAKNYAGDSDIIIYIDPTDKHLKAELEEATGVNLTISQTDFFGGSRAIIRSRNVLIDNSFASKLKEAKEAYEN